MWVLFTFVWGHPWWYSQLGACTWFPTVPLGLSPGLQPAKHVLQPFEISSQPDLEWLLREKLTDEESSPKLQSIERLDQDSRSHLPLCDTHTSSLAMYKISSQEIQARSNVSTLGKWENTLMQVLVLPQPVRAMKNKEHDFKSQRFEWQPIGWSGMIRKFYFSYKITPSRWWEVDGFSDATETQMGE